MFGITLATQVGPKHWYWGRRCVRVGHDDNEHERLDIGHPHKCRPFDGRNEGAVQHASQRSFKF